MEGEVRIELTIDKDGVMALWEGGMEVFGSVSCREYSVTTALRNLSRIARNQQDDKDLQRLADLLDGVI